MTTPIIQTPMQAVDEQTESYVNLTFLDQNNNPYTPTAVSYRIDAIRQNANVVPWTALGSLASSMVITVTSAQNTKLDGDPVEWRQVTIKVTAPGATPRNDQQAYALMKVPVRP